MVSAGEGINPITLNLSQSGLSCAFSVSDVFGIGENHRYINIFAQAWQDPAYSPPSELAHNFTNE